MVSKSLAAIGVELKKRGKWDELDTLSEENLSLRGFFSASARDPKTFGKTPQALIALEAMRKSKTGIRVLPDSGFYEQKPNASLIYGVSRYAAVPRVVTKYSEKLPWFMSLDTSDIVSPYSERDSKAIELEFAPGRSMNISPFIENLYSSIENSLYILDLKPNWDDQGSPGYTLEVWFNAITFLQSYLMKSLSSIDFGSSEKVIAPQIYHGPDKSLDFNWSSDEFEMLMNFPSDSPNVSYYYKNIKDSGAEIEGVFNKTEYRISEISKPIV